MYESMDGGYAKSACAIERACFIVGDGGGDKMRQRKSAQAVKHMQGNFKITFRSL
jgi:hypothetical protein